MAETISKDRGRAVDAWIPGFSYWSDEFIEELRVRNERLSLRVSELETEIRYFNDVRVSDWENCSHRFRHLLETVIGPWEDWTQELKSGYSEIRGDIPSWPTLTS